MKKVLIISKDFPPKGGSAVIRLMRFVKYMPRFGWIPIILAGNPSRFTKTKYDTSLLEKIPSEATVFRTHLFNLGGVARLFTKYFPPDSQVDWLPTIIIRGIQLTRKYGPNLIFSYGPPFSNLLGSTILSKITRVPLIIDFHDPWINDPDRKYPFKSYDNISRKMEEYVMKNISAAISVTIEEMKYFKEKYRLEDIRVVENGFDPEDFQVHSTFSPAIKYGVNSTGKPENQIKEGKIIFSHIGTFRGPSEETPFFEALAKVFLETPEYKNKCLFRFIGNTGKNTQIKCKNLNLEGTIEFISYLSHKEAIYLIMNSDYLMLFSDDFNRLKGKSFEYFASQKPILAFISERNEELKSILRTYSKAIIIDFHNREEIKKTLRNILDGELNFQAINNNSFPLYKYNAIYQTWRLTQIFDKAYLLNLQL